MKYIYYILYDVIVIKNYMDEKKTIEKLVNNIIDRKNQYIIDYVSKYNNLPQICLYYVIGTKNMDLCKICLDNNCVLDDFALKMSLLFHDPDLLLLFIKNRYQIPNNYAKYLFRFDKRNISDTNSTFCSDIMYNIELVTDKTENNLDIYDDMYDPITDKPIKKIRKMYLRGGLLPIIAKRTWNTVYNMDVVGADNDEDIVIYNECRNSNYYSKFLNFEWYYEKYKSRALFASRNGCNGLKLINVIECLDLLVKHNGFVISDEMTKYIIEQQIFRQKNFKNINQYDQSMVIDVVCDIISKKKNVKKCDIILIKKILKSMKIDNIENINIQQQHLQFIKKHIIL